MITFWDILTSIGFIIGDTAAVTATAGSGALLVVAIINLVAMRRLLYVPDIILQWCGACTGFGILSALGMIMMPDFNQARVGLILGLDYSTILLLLLVSMSMLLCTIVVRSAVPPNRTRPAAGTPRYYIEITRNSNSSR
jgi:hypothetical protein